MKRLFWIVVAFVGLTLASSVPASAAPCAVSSGTLTIVSGCTFTLTQANISQLAGVVVTVTITQSGGNTTFSFALTTNPLTNTFLGIKTAGWNLSNSVLTAPANYSTPNSPAPFQLDGFGQFLQAQTSTAQGIPSPSFTISGTPTTISANNLGNFFAVHLIFDGDCSGWVGGPGGPSSVGSDTNCVPIPEPASMVLLGTGLLGVAGFARRKFKRT